MTKKEMFMEIRNAVITNEEMVAFIDHEIELLNRKSNGSRKPTKKQIENEQLKAEIITYLTQVDTMKSIKELQAEIPSLAADKGITNQRITHMLSALIKENKLAKEYVKRTPFFYIPA